MIKLSKIHKAIVLASKGKKYEGSREEIVTKLVAYAYFLDVEHLESYHLLKTLREVYLAINPLKDKVSEMEKVEHAVASKLDVAKLDVFKEMAMQYLSQISSTQVFEMEGRELIPLVDLSLTKTEELEIEEILKYNTLSDKLSANS